MIAETHPGPVLSSPARPAASPGPRSKARVPAHQRRLARWRLACLRRWDRACAEAGDCGRAQAARQVAAQIRRERPRAAVSHQSLYRWQKAYQEAGLSGLCDGRWRRHAAAPSPDRRLVDLALSDLAALGRAVLDELANRLKASGGTGSSVREGAGS